MPDAGIGRRAFLTTGLVALTLRPAAARGSLAEVVLVFTGGVVPNPGRVRL